MRPLFSATNTRPSGAKRTAVGWLSPLNTVVSAKPEGSVTAAAPAGASIVARTSSEATSGTDHTRLRVFISRNCCLLELGCGDPNRRRLGALGVQDGLPDELARRR